MSNAFENEDCPSMQERQDQYFDSLVSPSDFPPMFRFELHAPLRCYVKRNSLRVLRLVSVKSSESARFSEQFSNSRGEKGVGDLGDTSRPHLITW